MKLVGIWGRPYIDLEPFVDTVPFEELHEEICLGLARADTKHVGGDLKWMNVAAPWVMEDGYIDFNDAIEEMDRNEVERLVELADAPSEFDLDDWRAIRFGDETPHALNRAQTRYLKFRYGAYFPWKVAFELLENRSWDDKNVGEGKQWERDALRYFPRLVRYIESLPFKQIGRAIIFGLEANDHATVHRDEDPAKQLRVPHSLTFCPAGNKRFYLLDQRGAHHTPVETRVYWFNDADYHGVEPAPYFRYSVRIDGEFTPEFFALLRSYHGRG